MMRILLYWRGRFEKPGPEEKAWQAMAVSGPDLGPADLEFLLPDDVGRAFGRRSSPLASWRR
jgi:hypothetical protein